MREAPVHRLAAAALIAGPAIFLLDNLLHPTELARGHEAEQLAEIAAASSRWQIAHLLGFVALLLFAAAAVALARIVHARRPALGLWGGAAAVAGLLALAGVLVLDGYTWGTLGELYGRGDLDAATLEETLRTIQESGWALPYYLTSLLWLAGMLALAWGLAPVVGRVPAGLLAAGVALVEFEGVVADNAYFVASSAVLLAGGVATAIALVRRSPDPAWSPSA